MTAPMIWSVAWDVTRGGWLGPTMVLWCYWWLGVTAYLVWLFGFLRCISEFCDIVYVHCDVAFSMFFPIMVRWIDVLPSCYSYSSSVHSSILCGSGTPRCGGSFLRIGRLFAFQRFLFFLGDHLSAWCDILKVSHAHRNSVVRYWKSITRLLEKCRTKLSSIALLLEKCHTTLLKCRMP